MGNLNCCSKAPTGGPLEDTSHATADEEDPSNVKVTSRTRGKGRREVSMAPTDLVNQMRRTQMSLFFLQQENISALTELYSEIEQLQQHYTDLTHELTLRSSEQTGYGTSRSSELKERCEELEARLKFKENDNNELLEELEEQHAVITVLENTIQEREEEYLDELRVKSRELNMLSSELDQRAGTIACLTAQLHATGKKLLSSSGTSDTSPSGSPGLASYKPAPPKNKLPETPRCQMRRSLSVPLYPQFEEVYRFGAESWKLLLREPVDATPDPTPFLPARDSAEVHLIKERPLVITPMASDCGTSEQHSLAHEQQPKAHCSHDITPPQVQPEVETLAVDQVNGGKVMRKHPEADRAV